MLYAYNQSSNNTKSHNQQIPFLWEDENYLLKMKTDMNFFIEHSLSKYFNFSDKSDPFLVIPSCAQTGVGLKGLKKARKKQISQNEQTKYEVPLDNSLMQRIKASEIIIEKEGKESNIEDATPKTNKAQDTPSKSPKKVSKIAQKHEHTNENTDPNGDVEMASNQRESLFDLRKKNKDKSGDTAYGPAHRQSNDKIMHPVNQKAEPIQEAVEPSEEEVDDVSFEYTLYPLKLAESGIQSFLEKYIVKLDDKFAKSYSTPSELYQKLQTGNNAQFYGLRNKGSTKDIDGLLAYNLDNMFNRVNILHLTTVNRKGIEEAVAVCIAHIWKNENAHEIRIGLYHFDGEKNGKPALVVDTDINSALTKHKLRWKNMLNEGNKRILVNGANRSDNREVDNDLDKLITVKSSLIYNITDQHKGDANTHIKSHINFIPGLYLNSLLSGKVLEDEKDQDHHKLFAELVGTVKETKLSCFPLITSESYKTSKDVNAAIKDKNLDINLSKMNQESEFYFNAVNLDTKLTAIDYCTHSVSSTKYKYIRMKTVDLVVVEVPTISSDVYFIPVGDHHTSYGLLLFKKPKDQKFNSRIELFNFCKDITSVMKDKESLNPSGVYIP